MANTIEIVTSRQRLADVDDKLAARLGRELDQEAGSIDLIRKAYADVKIDIDEGERAVIATISTEVVDRDNEVMLAKGADLKWFRKNPVVLYAHNYGSLPIGKAQWIRRDGNKLVAKTVFAPAEASPEAEQIYQLFKGGFLRAWSIGFIVLDSREPKKDEFDGNVRRVITKWQLLEYSAVPVPSNMEALTTAVGKGLALSDALKEDLGISRRAPSEIAYGRCPACGGLTPAEKLGQFDAEDDCCMHCGKELPNEASTWLTQEEVSVIPVRSAPDAHVGDSGDTALPSASLPSADTSTEEEPKDTDEGPTIQEIDERMQAIEATVDALTPATVTVTATELAQPTEQPKMVVPDDFGERFGKAFAEKLVQELGPTMDEKIAHARGRVRED